MVPYRLSHGVLTWTFDPGREVHLSISDRVPLPHYRVTCILTDLTVVLMGASYLLSWLAVLTLSRSLVRDGSGNQTSRDTSRAGIWVVSFHCFV